MSVSLRGSDGGTPIVASWLCASLLFLGLFAAYLSIWEPAHDEGVTFTQVMGPIGVTSCRQGGMPAAEATALLEPRAGHRASDVIGALMSDGMHPPGYYLGLHGVARLLGAERVWLAGCLGLLGLVSIFSIGRIAVRMAPGRHSALAAMLLLAVSPWFVGYSVLLRPYALVLCLGLLTTWSALEIHAPNATAGQRRLWRVLFVVLSSFGLYTLYHYGFVLAWQMLALFVFAWGSSRRGHNLAAWLGMGVTILLIFAPWIPRLLVHLGASSSSSYYFAGWPAAADWLPGLGHLLLVFALGEGLWSTIPDVLRLSAVFLGGLTLPWVLLSLRPRILEALDPLSRALWFVLPVIPALVLASDWVRDTHTIFLSKTNFMLLPIGILLIVRAFQALPSNRWSLIAMSAWLLLFGAAVGAAIHTRSWALTPFEVVSETIRRPDSPAHLVLLSSDARGYVVPFLLTLRKAGVREAVIADAPKAEVASCVEAALRNPGFERVTLVHFDVPYRPSDVLGPASLRSIAETAKEAAWTPVRLQPSQPRVSAVPGLDRWWRGQVEGVELDSRVMVISSPTKSWYFTE